METEKVPWSAGPSGAFGERVSNVVDVVALRSALWELAQARAQTDTLQELQRRVDELGEGGPSAHPVGGR